MRKARAFISVFLIAFICLCYFFGCSKSKESYTVFFNSQGGSTIESQIVESGENAIRPNNPLKPGFDFVEWQLDGEAYDFNRSVQNDIILTAVYSKNDNIETVFVTFDYQDGSSANVVEIQKGYLVSEPPIPQKEGYIFNGWYADEEKFDFSSSLDRDEFLVAKWEHIQTSKINTENNKNSLSTTKADVAINTTPSTSQSQYNLVANGYCGRWYLQGYADVCIDVSKSTAYKAIIIVAHNFSLPTDSVFGSHVIAPYTVYPQKLNVEGAMWGSLIEIVDEDWEAQTARYNIVFKENCIYINNNKFIQEKGTKDMYYDTCYREALGTWYMHNTPESKLIIKTMSRSDIDNGDLFEIETQNFDFSDLSCNVNTTVTGIAGLRRDWEQYGISVNNGVLTVKNSYGTRTFYRYVTEQTTATIPNSAKPSSPKVETTIPPTTKPIATNPSSTTTTPTYSDVRIISGTETISNETINSDVYITSTGRAVFENVTVNGDIYCYGQLSTKGNCSAHDVNAYQYGSWASCGAFDGTHGKITSSGNFKADTVTIKDNALDYAFSKWGKR